MAPDKILGALHFALAYHTLMIVHADYLLGVRLPSGQDASLFPL
jgi:hypothetical protein